MEGSIKPLDLAKRIKKIPRAFDDFYWEGGSKLAKIIVEKKLEIMEKRIKIVKIKKTDSRKAGIALQFRKTKVNTQKFVKDFEIDLQDSFVKDLQAMSKETIQQFILASDIIHDFGDHRFNTCGPEGASKEVRAAAMHGVTQPLGHIVINGYRSPHADIMVCKLAAVKTRDCRTILSG